MIGSRVGRYRIVRRLGSGGMGEVYEAEDERLGRRVALKLLPPALAADPVRLERFEREARALAALSHPHIVTIHSVDEVDGIHFLTMELLEGPTLADAIPAGGLPVARLLELAVPLAVAVAVAHDKGIVHRDLKPANVAVGKSGLKVLDFGLARVEPSTAGSSELATAGLTAEGSLLGTVPYMSPEQVKGRPLDPRSDIFSLGTVLYEMATGRRPFEGKTAADLISAILRDRPQAVTELRPEVPPELARIVRRCLEKDPERRYQTARDVLNDLRDLAEELASAGRAAGSARGVAASPDLTQEVRFCSAADGVRLAYATVGSGPPLAKAANWLNHLEHDWESPYWRPTFRELARDRGLVRYDARGSGLSDWDVETIDFDGFVSDLEAVVDAAGLERFALLGISQGCAVSIAYAVRHPERVSRLILHGGFAVGWRLRDDPEEVGRREAMGKLMRYGWGQENPAFREMFTATYFPDSTAAQRDSFTELQRISASPANAERFWEAVGRIDVRDLLPNVEVPTLVLHCRGDLAVPFAAGRQLATGIPGARFVALDSRNHLLLEQETAWPRFLAEMKGFLAEE